MLILVCVLLLILAAALIFLKTWPAFGGQASKADMEDYERRADHYSGGKFSNSEPFEMMTDHMEEDDKILCPATESEVCAGCEISGLRIKMKNIRKNM